MRGRYVLLSIVSKGILGVVLLANILLVSQDVDEALAERVNAQIEAGELSSASVAPT